MVEPNRQATSVRSMRTTCPSAKRATDSRSAPRGPTEGLEGKYQSIVSLLRTALLGQTVQ